MIGRPRVKRSNLPAALRVLRQQSVTADRPSATGEYPPRVLSSRSSPYGLRVSEDSRESREVERDMCFVTDSHRERRTHGDNRYFGEGLHRAIKLLWPDETPAVPCSTSGSGERKRTRSSSQPTVSTRVAEFVIPTDSLPTVFRVNTTTRVTIDRGESTGPDRSRRKLPGWIQAQIVKRDVTEESSGESDGESDRESHKRSARLQRQAPPPADSLAPLPEIDGVEQNSLPPQMNRKKPPPVRRVGRPKENSDADRHVAELVSDLQILKPPKGSKNRGHLYVTRSLFKDSCYEE
ncbi:hypothetical protein R1sor_012447 [Riccia sorocarpa]|uniref:Uncharacterized protein n=1 Tax=Riccia sorocarpa TaxID=122646 RepID=A0ABD3I504_9MARC